MSDGAINRITGEALIYFLTDPNVRISWPVPPPNRCFRRLTLGEGRRTAINIAKLQELLARPQY
jgi:hypothetical protein